MANCERNVMRESVRTNLECWSLLQLLRGSLLPSKSPAAGFHGRWHIVSLTRSKLRSRKLEQAPALQILMCATCASSVTFALLSRIPLSTTHDESSHLSHPRSRH